MSHIEKRELSAWHNDRKIPPKGDFGRDDGVVGPKRTVPGGISYFRDSLETILSEPYSEWQEFIMDKAKDILINHDDFLKLIFKEQGVLLKRYKRRISTSETIKQSVELDRAKDIATEGLKSEALYEDDVKDIYCRYKDDHTVIFSYKSTSAECTPETLQCRDQTTKEWITFVKMVSDRNIFDQGSKTHDISCWDRKRNLRGRINGKLKEFLRGTLQFPLPKNFNLFEKYQDSQSAGMYRLKFTIVNSDIS